MGTAIYRVANLVTIALDLVVVALVATLVSRRGLQAPAGLVLVPMWVGSGLLAPVALGVPLGTAVQIAAGGSAVPLDAGLDHWVFALVYGGFVAQALILAVAFCLYVRRRWPWAFANTHPQLPDRTRQLQQTLLVLAVPAAILHGCAFAVWALGAGEPGGDPAAVETLAQRVTYGVRAALPIVGAAATVMLVRRGSRPAVLVGAWLGSGYLFAAGMFGGPATTVGHLVDIVGIGSGLTLAMAGFLALPTPATARDRT